MEEIIATPTISLICGFVGKSLKTIPKFPDKYIPIATCIAGMILGLICYYTLPGYIPATNWLSALVIGLVSGGFSTTSNQTYKQLKKG